MTTAVAPFPQETERQRLRKLMAALKTERSSFDAHWREIGDVIKPRRTRFTPTDRNRGDRRNQKIIDSTATYAARTLASGMMSGVTSPARPWFRLTTPDPDLAEFGPVKDWLHIVTQRMQTVMLRSNLYNALPVIYGDMGTFGTAAMAVMEDADSVIRCFPFAVGSYYLANDALLRVRVFAREYQMTVRQVVEQFGTRPGSSNIDWTNISQRVRDAWNNGNYEQWIDINHVVLPNAGYNEARLGSKYKHFRSCYFEWAGAGAGYGNDTYGNPDNAFLSERGFDEFPILAPRWEVTGEDVYGTDCPGMTVLGDVKALQLMKKLGLQAIEKMVKPPMVAPPEMRTQKLSILPGDVSYVAESEHKKFRPAMEVNINLADLREETGEVKDLIRRGFYEDLFLMIAQLDRRQITATEINERREEKLLALGPVLEQLNQDALDPLIDRVYAIMDRRGLIPTPPEELHGVALRVEYISVMAQAQKAVGLGAIERFASFSTQVVAIDPAALDKIDTDQMLDEYGDGSGIPPRIVRSDEQVAAMRQARAAAKKAQDAAEMASTVAPAVHQLSQSPTTGNNALAALLTSGGGNVAGLLPAGSPA